MRTTQESIVIATGLLFTNPAELNVQEKKEVQQKLNTIMSFVIHNEDFPNRKETVLYIRKLSRKVGQAVGKYAQYSYGFDLDFAQIQDESILRLIGATEVEGVDA